jgi:uncharacterized protein
MTNQSFLPNKRRSRSLRKKLCLGECQVLGFEMAFKFAPHLATDDRIETLRKFIAEAIEPRGLAFGGGGCGFVALASRVSATIADSEAVGFWLRTCAAVRNVQVGQFRDAWHGYGTRDVLYL